MQRLLDSTSLRWPPTGRVLEGQVTPSEGRAPVTDWPTSPGQVNRGKRWSKADRKEVPVKAIAAQPFPNPGLGPRDSDPPNPSPAAEPRAAARSGEAISCAALRYAPKDREVKAREGHALVPHLRRRGGEGKGSPGRRQLGVRHTYTHCRGCDQEAPTRNRNT